ncbi:MAG TPA: hypothetical protein VGS15_09465 [Candidatus Acidoferrales bacterium]|nr:hypothetical protein [Candidatus Acidoferrales bacterium]
MADSRKPRGRALDEAVSRAVRDSLPALQHSIEELHQAIADLVSACSSARPTNTLPAMLRAQTNAASLSASLSVLASFITSAVQRREHESGFDESSEGVQAVGVALPPPERREHAPLPPAPMASRRAPVVEPEEEEAEEPAVEATRKTRLKEAAEIEPEEIAAEPEEEEVAQPETVAFDVASLPREEQELHKRANRVAKVSMQDIKMLKPEEVRKGCENKDICTRLRGELDKARKEYDRRFQKILDHPVDYFHHWMVEVLAGGDPEALGDYPYPSPVVRR